MARKTTNPAQNISRLAKQKLPKELVDTMRTLPNLYWFKSKTIFRTRKQFQELFYSHKTSNATRTFMLWAGLYRDTDKPNDMLMYNTSLQKQFGKRAGYKIDYVHDRKGNAVGLKLVAYSSKSRNLEDVKFTPLVVRSLKYAQFDKLSGNMVNQMVNKKVDIARGMKAGVVIAQVQKFIMSVIWQIEATISVQSKHVGNNSTFLIGSPDDDDVFYDYEETDEYLMDFDLDPHMFLKSINLGGFKSHVQHYLSEFDNKISKFLPLLDAEWEGEEWRMEYEEWGTKTIAYDGYIGTYQQVAEVAETICNDAVSVLQKTHEFADKISKCRFDTKAGKARLKTIKASTKVPIVRAHESTGYNLPDNSAMIQKRYTQTIEDTVSKLAKWAIPKKV